MSYLRWKKESKKRKSLFFIANPIVVFWILVSFVSLLLPLVQWLRSLMQ